MTEPNVSTYFKGKTANETQQRRFAQNSLIVDTAIAINKALESEGMSQKELAKRLGRSEGFVSQVLSGGGNLTLRTLADLAYGLGYVVDVGLRPKGAVVVSEDRTLWNSITVSAPPKAREACDTQYVLAA